MAARTLLTYADYAALPDDMRRYELHEGELFTTPAPGTAHQRVLMALATLLYTHVRSLGLGEVLAAPTDCILSDHTVVQPDILYVARERLTIISRRGIEGAPTLAVEVLSPTTAAIDLGLKRTIYSRHGVPWHWIVDPEARTIDAYRLVSGRYASAGRLIGGRPLALPPFDTLVLDPTSIWP